MKTLHNLLIENVWWMKEQSPTNSSKYVFAEAPFTRESPAFIVDQLKSPSIGMEICNFHPLGSLCDVQAIMALSSTKNVIDLFSLLQGNPTAEHTGITLTTRTSVIKNQFDSYYFPSEKVADVIDWLVEHDSLQWDEMVGQISLDYQLWFEFKNVFGEFESSKLNKTTYVNTEHERLFGHLATI